MQGPKINSKRGKNDKYLNQGCPNICQGTDFKGVRIRQQGKYSFGEPNINQA